MAAGTSAAAAAAAVAGDEDADADAATHRPAAGRPAASVLLATAAALLGPDDGRASFAGA